jgi:hypothetical protein
LQVPCIKGRAEEYFFYNNIILFFDPIIEIAKWLSLKEIELGARFDI